MKLAIYLLVMINPFAQVLYMWEVMKALSVRDFAATYWYASVMSLGVFVLFALTGESLFTQVFQVGLDAFRIFGGLVILLIALRYYTVGAGSTLVVQGEAIDLAPQVSLPYIVGPGTIWVSILMGRTHGGVGLLLIAGALAVNFVAVVLAGWGMSRISKDLLLFKYIETLMRVNALFIGAIAVEMILTGLTEAFGSRL